MLFVVWTERPHRATRDADLLGFGDVTVDEMRRIFRSLCAMTVEPDGLAFRADSVAGVEIRTGQEYPGVRITLDAELARALIPSAQRSPGATRRIRTGSRKSS